MPRSLDLVWVILGLGVAFAVGMLVRWSVTRRLSRALSRVVDSVDRIGRGEPDVAGTDGAIGEISPLVQSVNRTGRAVGERIRALEDERQARDAILSALEDGVALFDSEGALLYRNERARDLLGPSVAHIRSLSNQALRSAAEEASAGARRVLEAVIGPGSRTIQASIEPIPGDGHVLMVLRDVTDARMVDAVRRDFVANASHELKTPVASIRALAETIASATEEDPDAVPRFAAQLDLEAIRLARVLSDLLDLSRLEGGSDRGSEVRFDLLVAREAGQLTARARDAGLSLTVDGGSGVTVIGSERDLGLLVRNLVQNAVQYTRPKGSVKVSVRAEGKEAVLEVRDTGIGIPRTDQARVFERFYRVDRARSRETGGTGLGLSIVKHVAENHGGSVSVASELGRGSTFIVRLPLPG